MSGRKGASSGSSAIEATPMRSRKYDVVRYSVAVVSGFGSVFVSYFLDGPVVSYDDLLANDVDLFVGYRRELMKDGIFELPLNLKRSHFSYAHSEDDVDRLLEATEGAVERYLETRA